MESRWQYILQKDMIAKLINTKMLQIVDASSELWLASTLAILTVGFGIVYLCSPQRRARQSSYSERNQWHDTKVSLIATHSKLSPLYNF